MSLTRIIATGCHNQSGLGHAALLNLVRSQPTSLPPPYHITLYVRDKTSSHVQQACEILSQIVNTLPGPSKVEAREMDLASTSSVRSAANQLVSEMESEGQRIDVVLMNAAVAKATRTMIECSDPLQEGDIFRDEKGRYEETALVNHVSPLLFLSILRPLLISQPSLPTGSTQIPTRIVFTGSALHRRVERETLDSAFNPTSTTSSDFFWSLRTTYAASKLLQAFGVQRFADLLEQEIEEKGSESKIEVVIVQPGFVPSTNLNRESSPSLKFIMSWIFPILPFDFIQTLEGGGETIMSAMSKQLFSFPAAASTSEKEKEKNFPPRGKWAPFHTIQDQDSEGKWIGSGNGKVRRALIVKGKKLEHPDVRTEEVDVQKKWWPKACNF